jgi:hypothetical protein
VRRLHRLPHRSHRRILELFRYWDDPHGAPFRPIEGCHCQRCRLKDGDPGKFTPAEIFRDHLREVRLFADLDSMDSSPHVMHRLLTITQSWKESA